MTRLFDEELTELLKQDKYPEFKDEGFYQLVDHKDHSKEDWDLIYQYKRRMEKNRIKILELDTQIDYLTARRPTPVKL